MGGGVWGFGGTFLRKDTRGGSVGFCRGFWGGGGYLGVQPGFGLVVLTLL